MEILDYRKHAKALRTPNRLLTPNDLETAEFKSNFQAMHDLLKIDGVGLAASQIGWNVKLFTLCIDSKGLDAPLQTFINPKILVSSKGIAKENEGCLSFPELFFDVKRPVSIVWEYTDLDWKTHKVESDGFFARAVQHETDHCEAKLFIDHATSAQKLEVNRWLKSTVMLR